MAKINRPTLGSFEYTKICWGPDPKPAWHLKECAGCAKRKADKEHYWKWRVKDRDNQPCSDIVCRECGWNHDEHGKKLAEKILA